MVTGKNATHRIVNNHAMTVVAEAADWYVDYLRIRDGYDSEENYQLGLAEADRIAEALATIYGTPVPDIA